MQEVSQLLSEIPLRFKYFLKSSLLCLYKYALIIVSAKKEDLKVDKPRVDTNLKFAAVFLKKVHFFIFHIENNHT